MIRCKLVEQLRADANAGGGRIGRAVSGKSLTLGRAASCKIYLPDPRVRLDHALIRRADDGHLYLDAIGPVFVNQRAETSVRLERGQTIGIGPFDFVVEELSDEADLVQARLTLTYAERESAMRRGPDTYARQPVGPRDSWLSRRRLSWLLSLIVIALCAALPAWHAYHPEVAQSTVAAPAVLALNRPVASEPPGQAAQAPHLRVANWVLANTTGLDGFWNPGPISSAHSKFAQDCQACHAKPFERVADASCTACHKTVGAHIADKRIDDTTFKGQRCATCHKDHQGSGGMRVADAVGCVQCHANIGRFSPLTALRDVSDFARDHPPFRLSVRQGGEPSAVRRVAQVAGLKNDTGLVFAHDIHLAKAGIKSPTGPAATGGRVVLDCANCHTLDAANARYEPVRMDKHCQSCHRLSVDLQAPERQVPHAKPEVVRTAVREIYASLAVDRYPVSLVTVNSLLQRPASEPPALRSISAGRWVQEQSERALSAMLDSPNGECRTCHRVMRQAAGVGKSVGWEIAPIVTTSHWLPHTRFSHAQHQNAKCSACHQTSSSKSATDSLVPDLQVCQGCHAGAQAEQDKVVSRCESCHGFHGKTVHPAFGKSAMQTEGSR